MKNRKEKIRREEYKLRRAVLGDSKADARFEVALEPNNTDYPTKSSTGNRYCHCHKHHNVVPSSSHGSNSEFFSGEQERQTAASQEKAPQSLSWWPRGQD